MQVMVGWTAEVTSGQWYKHDVTLDETDFATDTQQFSLPTPVPTSLKYEWLSNEALLLLSLWVSEQVSGAYARSAEDTAAKCLAERTRILTRMRDVG